MMTTELLSTPGLSTAAPPRHGLAHAHAPEATSLPLVIRPSTAAQATDPAAVTAWFAAQQAPLQQLLRKYGALLLRGFALGATSDFMALSAVLPEHRQGYLGGATPRAVIAGSVFESTRLPPPFKLQLHQEMSYLPHRPAQLMFFCKVAPQQGGETIIADMRQVTAALPDEVLRAFNGRRILYRRHLLSPQEARAPLNRMLGDYQRSWAAVFDSEDRDVVEQRCRAMALDFEWDADGGMTVCYTGDVYGRHPHTGALVWFNHICTLHDNPRSMGVGHALLDTLKRAGRKPPFVVTFENGQDIPLPLIHRVMDELDRATVAFPWQAGDVLWVDNMLVAHGRNPYAGAREIQVTLHD